MLPTVVSRRATRTLNASRPRRGFGAVVATLLGMLRQRRPHDYRQHWAAFTRRLGLMRSGHDVASELAVEVERVTGPSAVAVYLAQAGESGYRLSTSLGSRRFVSTIDQAGAVPSWLNVNASPAALPACLAPSVTAPALSSAMVVAIRWRTKLLGFVLIEPQRSAPEYSAEDVDFLATMAEQAAAAITAVAQSAATQSSIETVDRS